MEARQLVIKGKKAWLNKYVGRVSDSRQWQETWVTGNAYTGYTQHRADKQAFWFVSDERESEIRSDIQVRNGHVVTLVYGGYEGKPGPLLLIYNNTLGEYNIEVSAWGEAKKKWAILDAFMDILRIGIFIIGFPAAIIALNGRSYGPEEIIWIWIGMIVSYLLMRLPLVRTRNFYYKLIREAKVFVKE